METVTIDREAGQHDFTIVFENIIKMLEVAGLSPYLNWRIHTDGLPALMSFGCCNHCYTNGRIYDIPVVLITHIETWQSGRVYLWLYDGNKAVAKLKATNAPPPD